MEDLGKLGKSSGALVPTPGFALEASEGTRGKIIALLSLLTQGIQQGNIRRRWREIANSATPEELDTLVRNPHLRNNSFFEAVYNTKTTLPETRRFILSTYSLCREVEGERISGDYRWIQGAIENLVTHEDQNAVIQNPDSTIRTLLARSPKLVDTLQIHLMKDKDKHVRLALAERKDLHMEVSNLLIIDNSEHVRCQAMIHSQEKTSVIEGILLDEYPEYNTFAMKIRVLERMDYSRRYFDDVLENIGIGEVPTDLALLISISPFSTSEIRKRFLSLNTKTIKSGISDDITF